MFNFRPQGLRQRIIPWIPQRVSCSSIHPTTTRPRAGWARITGPPLAMDGSKVLCKSLGHVWGAQKRRPTERSSQPSGPAQRLTSLGLAKAGQIPGKQTSHEGRNESEDASKAEVYCSTCLMLN